MRIDYFRDLSSTVGRALSEDLGAGDVSGALVPADQQARARILVREPAVLCGQAWAAEVFHQIDANVRLEWQANDGDELAPGQVFCQLQGPARALLSGERTALNFLQTLSATATTARHHAQAVAATGCRILDTRKTLPGLRLAQKYAVHCGGASNHRIGLFDAYLIKENHIAAAGGIAAAIAAAKARDDGLLIEIEVETLEQLAEAIQAGAQRVLLDNFDTEQLRAAVGLSAGRVELEASGGVSRAQLRSIAETGVDFISVGALTKDIKAIDLSMRFD